MYFKAALINIFPLKMSQVIKCKVKVSPTVKNLKGMFTNFAALLLPPGFTAYDKYCLSIESNRHYRSMLWHTVCRTISFFSAKKKTSPTNPLYTTCSALKSRYQVSSPAYSSSWILLLRHICWMCKMATVCEHICHCDVIIPYWWGWCVDGKTCQSKF